MGCPDRRDFTIGQDRRADRQLPQAEPPVIGRNQHVPKHAEAVRGEPGRAFAGNQRVHKHAAAERDRVNLCPFAKARAARRDDFHNRRVEPAGDSPRVGPVLNVGDDGANQRPRVDFLGGVRFPPRRPHRRR